MEELEFKQFEKMVMPIYRKEFARRLKQCMLANNIKQVDLVERTGINKSKISSYCSGRYMPKSENLVKIANILNVEAAYLMGIDIENEKKIKPKRIPIVGKIAAGKPLFAEENIEGYDFAPSSYMLEDYNYFFLRVKGDSMNLKFKEGDLVLVQQQNCLEQRRNWYLSHKWRYCNC